MTVVVPARDEAASIGGVVRGLRDAGVSRVIVADDGSRDGTGALAAAAGADVVRTDRRGYGWACLAGTRAAAGSELVGYIDGDGSFDPRDLARLGALVVDGADLALGARSHDGAMPLHQRAGNALALAALRALYGVALPDVAPLRVVRGAFLEELGMEGSRYAWLVEMVARAARRGAHVAVSHVSYGPRRGGRSKVSGSLRGSALAGLDFFRALLVHVPARILPRAVFALLAIAYVVVGAWTTRQVSATGDEPYYFMAADALLRREGLELGERLRSLTLRTYGPGGGIPPEEFLRQTAPSLIREGRYPLHDPGLSFLIALPYAVGGRGLVVALMGVAMAAALALACRAALALGIEPRAAVAGAVGAGLAAPALTYSGQVFADSLAPLVVALALAGTLGAAPRWSVGLAIAALPLLHVRFWPLALGLLVIASRRMSLVRLVAPLAGVVVALGLLDLVVYGVPVPHAGFLVFFTGPEGRSLATYGAPGGPGALGIFLDRAFGLVPAAPLMVLTFVGVGAALRSGPLRGWLGAASGYVVFVSLLDWTGGYSPQARYLAPLVPILAVLLAYALAHDAARHVAFPLAAWTAAQSFIYVARPGLRYDVFGVAPYADLAWERYLGMRPSAVFPLLGSDGSTAALLAAWTGALVALLAAGWMLSRRRHIAPASSVG